MHHWVNALYHWFIYYYFWMLDRSYHIPNTPFTNQMHLSVRVLPLLNWLLHHGLASSELGCSISLFMIFKTFIWGWPCNLAKHVFLVHNYFASVPIQYSFLSILVLSIHYAVLAISWQILSNDNSSILRKTWRRNRMYILLVFIKSNDYNYP